MRINKLSEECIQDLQKIIGGRISSIFIERLCSMLIKGGIKLNTLS